MTNKEACEVFIKQQIEEGLRAGKTPYSVGKEISKWIEQLFMAKIPANTIEKRAYRTHERIALNEVDTEGERLMKKNGRIPRLSYTEDYRGFEPSEFNRDVLRTKNLEKSMREHGFDPGYPLRCVRGRNGKLEIRSGHHRFFVAQLLGIGIYYIVSPNDLSLFEEQKTVRNWNLTDYVVAHTRAGNEDIAEIKRFSERTGIGLSDSAAALSGISTSGKLTQKLINGTYKTGNGELAECIENVTELLKMEGVSFCTHTGFQSALRMMLLTPGFSVDMLLRKAKTHKQVWEKCRSLEDYLMLLETVMNFQTPTKQKRPWVHLAKQAAAERQKAIRFGKESS